MTAKKNKIWRALSISEMYSQIERDDLKSDEMIGVLTQKALTFHESGLHLLSCRAISILFPEVTSFKDFSQYKDSKKVYKKIQQEQKGPKGKEFCIKFMKEGPTRISLYDEASFSLVSKYCFTICWLFLLCRELYQEHGFDGLMKIYPGLERHSLFVAMDAGELQGYWIAKMNERIFENNRIAKAIDAKQRKKEDKKQRVIEEYYQSGEIKQDTRPHTMGRIIHQKLAEKIDPPPSVSTIKRYLESEGLI